TFRYNQPLSQTHAEFHVGVHAWLESQAWVGKHKADFVGAGQGVQVRVDVIDRTSPLLTGIVCKGGDRFLSLTNEGQLILVNVGLYPNGGEVSELIEGHSRLHSMPLEGHLFDDIAADRGVDRLVELGVTGLLQSASLGGSQIPEQKAVAAGPHQGLR